MQSSTNSTVYGSWSDNGTSIGDRFREEYGLWVHPHWYQYHDVIRSVSDSTFSSLGGYISVVCIVGAIASIAVIVITLSDPSLRTLPNMLVVDLAISDTVFALFCGFPMMGVACFRRKWTWSDTGCDWYAFLSAITGLNSINCLACIAIDRYMVISRQRTHFRTVSMMVAALAWSLVWATPPMLGWSRYIGEGLMVSCTFDYLTRTPSNIAYTYCLVVFQFALPMMIIVCCYISIVRTVGRCAKNWKTDQLQQMTVHTSRIERERKLKEQELMRYECRLAKVAAVMITLFVLSWLPYATVALLGISGLKQFVTPYSTEIPIVFAKASYVWNPLIYALTHPRYKAILLRCLRGGEPEIQDTGANLRLQLRKPTGRGVESPQEMMINVANQRQSRVTFR